MVTEPDVSDSVVGSPDAFQQGDRIKMAATNLKPRILTDEEGNDIVPINTIMRDAGLRAICDIISRLPSHGVKNFYHTYVDFDATRPDVVCPDEMRHDNRALILLYEDYYDLHLGPVSDNMNHREEFSLKDADVKDVAIHVRLGQIFSTLPGNVPHFTTPDTGVNTPCRLPDGTWCGYVWYRIPLTSINNIAIPDYMTRDEKTGNSESGFYFGVQFTGQGRF